MNPLRDPRVRRTRGTRECVALLDRNLVVRGALVCGRFLAGVSLLRRCVLLRLGRDTVDLGVGLSLDQRGVRFLAHPLRQVALTPPPVLEAPWCVSYNVACATEQTA